VRPQVKRNVQRTLATELQRLSVQFRKQQKQHLNQLRQQKEGAGGSWLHAGPSGDTGDEYDPGFSDIQVGWQGCRHPARR
jgi:syntaxin 16